MPSFCFAGLCDDARFIFDAPPYQPGVMESCAGGGKYELGGGYGEYGEAGVCGPYERAGVGAPQEAPGVSGAQAGEAAGF